MRPPDAGEGCPPPRGVVPADDMFVLEGGMVALRGSVEALDRSAVNELLAVYPRWRVAHAADPA